MSNFVMLVFLTLQDKTTLHIKENVGQNNLKSHKDDVTAWKWIKFIRLPWLTDTGKHLELWVRKTDLESGRTIFMCCWFSLSFVTAIMVMNKSDLHAIDGDSQTL